MTTMKWTMRFCALATSGLLVAACSNGSGDDSSRGGDSMGISESLGDGDGDGDMGDGDGDATATATATGDGDGDGDVGDGDGDGDAGDGDGDGDIKFDVNGGVGGGDGPDACEVIQPQVTYIPPVLIFVLDKSGSMSINTFNAGGMGNITRWNALHNTVEYLVNTFESQVLFGSKRFPSANGCPVNNGLDVNPALNNGAAILASLPGKTADLNNGGTSYTPAERGFEEAKANIQTQDPMGGRAIVLILDGDVSTNCSPNTVAGLQTDIADLYNTDGVPTYVVGIDIGAAGTTTNMNLFAEAGGVPKGNPGDPERFYNAVNQAELDQIMNEIVDDVLSCEISLDVEPDSPLLTEVTVDGTTYPLITEADCNNNVAGWYYSVEYSEIKLCGVACDEFLTVQTAQVEYFCPQG